MPTTKQPTPPVELPCDVCRFDLATDVGRGWVSCFQTRALADDAPGEVQVFSITCQKCAVGLRAKHDAAGLLTSDMHLDSYTGELALLRLTHMMWEHRWTRDALNKCLGFFLVAAKLPTCPPDRKALYLRLWGTDPRIL